MPDAPKGGEYVAISTPETGDREDADAGDEPAVPAKSPPGAAPMGFASTGSCFVALTNTILGSGMLGLPHAFSSCGYVLGLFFLVAGALASSLGLHLLACSAVRAAHARQPFVLPCPSAARRLTPARLHRAEHAVDARGQALPYVVLQGGEVCAPGASSHAPLCRARSAPSCARVS